MKTSTKVVLAVIVLLAVFLIYKAATATAEPGIYDEFAQCLTDSGTVMYGAYWCPHCQNQKAMFGSSFDYAPYVECDPRGDNAQPELCNEKGIQGYPTWIFSDGTQRSGEVPLRTLAALSGCELPS
jgi:glutaredoxin